MVYFYTVTREHGWMLCFEFKMLFAFLEELLSYL